VISVLRGEREEKIVERRHDQLSTFGIGADIDARTWHAVLRQLVARGLVEVAHERYGALELTEAAAPVLRGQEQVMLAKANLARAAERPKGGRSRTRGAGGASDAPPVALGLDAESALRFAKLRTWRLAAAKEHGVPPYVIFHDAHLAEIARRDPTDLDDLHGVPGVGAAKLERYGEAVIAALHGE
jgi:ATP-dependent DNA helicase RecQ